MKQADAPLRTGTGPGPGTDPALTVYRVGGSVRDELLGLPVKDRDWVVVGATVQQMLDHGFRQVGRDFPVFMHPDSHEEYALARTERKTGPGYHGFVVHADPSVSIEDDLARRDLTINAIAVADDGTIVDPHDGRSDIAARVLRHVGEAFIEDPVRVLRVARFAARFPDFDVAPETLALMRRIAAEGELDALVPERVWQELSRGLMAARPSRMLEVLVAADAWAVLMPELDAVQGTTADLAALDRAAAQAASLPARFAVLVAGLAPASLDAICERLRLPADCRELAQTHARVAAALPGVLDADPAALQQLLAGIDALRRPRRLDELIAIEAARARLPAFDAWRRRLERAAAAAARIDQAAVARAAGRADPGRGGEAIRAAIRAAQVEAIAAELAMEQPAR